MKKINIPVGISDFEVIRQNNYYYVDKTGLISEILRAASNSFTLITRPRRFGKTLGMNMLASFFDIQKDSRDLFMGLEVSKDALLCEEWMNKWPVVFITFKSIGGLRFSSAYGMLRIVISRSFSEHAYLLESENIAEEERNIIRCFIRNEASEEQIKDSLQFLLEMMQKHIQTK